MRNAIAIAFKLLITLTMITSVVLITDADDTDSESYVIPTNMTATSSTMNYASLNDFSYSSYNDAVTITGYHGDESHVTIPETIEGMPVKYIGNEAFMDDSEIKSVLLPEGLVSIGNSAFMNCTGITHVDIPDNVSGIGVSAFRNCSSLTEVIFGTDVNKIHSSAFRDCVSLNTMQFKGDAPETSSNWNTSVSEELRIYHVEGATGFDDTWSMERIILGKPGAPTDLDVTHSSEKLRVEWNHPTLADEQMILNYEVFFKMEDDQNWTCVGDIHELHLIILDLENGTEYEIRVAAVNIAGIGVFSNTLSSIPSTIPEAPNVVGTSEDASVLLTWNVPENGGAEILEYRIYQNDTKILTEQITDNSYRIDGLENEENYIFQITALNINGESPMSSPIEITPVKICAIHFDTKGGDLLESIIQNRGTEITPPENPRKEGSTFIGWTPNLPDIMPESDLTVSAIWYTNVECPSAALDLYYNGYDQVGIVARTGYILNGDIEMRDVGTYTAHAIPEKGYIWSDGNLGTVEIEWSIMPKLIVVTPKDGQAKIFTQEDPQIDFVLSEDVLVKGELSRVAGEDVGEYKINLGNLSVDKNHVLKLSDSDLYFKIDPKSIETLEISIDDATYTGSKIIPEVLVKDEAVLVLGMDYEVSFYENISAGTASAIISGIGNYSKSFLTNFTIFPKTITIKADDVSVIFSETPKFTVSYEGFVPGQDPRDLKGVLSLICYYDGTTYNNYFSINPEGLSSTNYEITYQSGILSIEKAIASEPIVNVNLFYNGEEQTGIKEGVGYFLSNHQATDAGGYVAMTILKNGYVWQDKTSTIRTLDWAICPKIVYVTPENGQSKLYCGNEPVLKYDLSENIYVSGDLNREVGEHIGNYIISIGTLTSLDDNYNLKISEQTITMEIVAAPPGEPTDVEIELDGCNAILSWCAPSFDGGNQITKYEVWANTDDDGVWILFDIVSNTRLSVIDLDYGLHNFAVTAVNEIGASDLSIAPSIFVYKEAVSDCHFALCVSMIFAGFNIIAIILFKRL